jgi:hypothetical protein
MGTRLTLAGERVAAEGRSVLAGVDVEHDVVIGQRRRYRKHAPRQRLAWSHKVHFSKVSPWALPPPRLSKLMLGALAGPAIGHCK